MKIILKSLRFFLLCGFAVASLPAMATEASDLNYYYCGEEQGACVGTSYDTLFREVDYVFELFCTSTDRVPEYHDFHLLQICQNQSYFMLSIGKLASPTSSMSALEERGISNTICQVNFGSSYTKGKFSPALIKENASVPEVASCIVLWHFFHQISDGTVCEFQNFEKLFKLSETLDDLVWLFQDIQKLEMVREGISIRDRYNSWEREISRRCRQHTEISAKSYLVNMWPD